MTKNIRISLYILIPTIFWMLSGFFVAEKKETIEETKKLFTVGTIVSKAVEFQPLIKLKATTESEARVNVKAKTSGEVVKIGATQGQFVEKDSILCSLGVVELNRTEVKAPFSGYLEQIVKPGNYLERGQVCATIIQLNPITFMAEVPEFKINKVKNDQGVVLKLVTGEEVEGKLTFVSKSASPTTRTFKVESQVKNPGGFIRDGLTADMTIKIDKVLAHKISPSILLLSDEGKLGIRSVKENLVEFNEIIILEDSADGVWIVGIPEVIEIIIQGQGFVENGQKVSINSL
ncbi:efflux RND transporter periplasmic adaptor subunit [Gammaproteobacteria bacterium]|jgi:multidrug efflux pump subunit AcrA (membrane-fusion protein)|nr:efflux RND transporter periplasmic adaptor subunit [Gammaproteobacteria bacterium]MDA7844282.1 efflux RND transporter periplasmic adaptor subunit [Gammaproteobacteria bacterium]MDB4159256.1 efflux RND transporter periplasmic adaptor subunit [Gammaproteobacteria bacterium]